MTTILILVADESIGDLLWRYVELASCAPALPRADERPTAAVLRVQPAALVIDASLGADALAVERVAAERALPVVYVASAMSDAELRAHAAARGAPHAPLTGGSRRLGSTLREVLEEGASAAGRPASRPLAADVALVAHARGLAERAQTARESKRLRRAEQEITLAMCRESQAALRQALAALARSLRSDGVSPERAITMMRGAVLNALDAAGSARDARRTLEAAERCWREVFTAAR
ncbi:MAG TPA: hypothetical protein VEA99_18815 [Gemmatimonadaceae bacterium]|nr:hypothetical protein [Gemmatimonadaceae bacterium]